MKHILFIGHGSSDQDSINACESVTERVQQTLPHMTISLCYLELSSPSIEEGITSLYEDGALDVTVIPLILAPAGHYQRDIPEKLEKMAARYPSMTLHFGEHLGSHPLIVHALNDSRRAWERAYGTEAEKDVLIVVSQGSSDPGAAAITTSLCTELAQTASCEIVEPAYMVMAEPGLKTVLAQMNKEYEGRCLVVPFFLFDGTMYKKIQHLSEETGIPAASCFGTGELFHDILVDRILSSTTLPVVRYARKIS